MSCDCSKAKQLPVCFDTLIIGSVTNGAESYYVYFKTPDGRIDRYEGVDIIYTNLVGVEGAEVRTGTIYEVWITSRNASSANTRTEFIPIDETEAVTCVLVEFTPCYDDSELVEFNSQTITLQ